MMHIKHIRIVAYMGARKSMRIKCERDHTQTGNAARGPQMRSISKLSPCKKRSKKEGRKWRRGGKERRREFGLSHPLSPDPITNATGGFP